MNTSSTITPHEGQSSDGERFVASGSTCACYLLQRHGRLLLKKQLLPAFVSDKRHREALEKEFEIGFQLNHPNIPQYLELQGDALLMEYVDGVTLTNFLKQNPNYFQQRHHRQQLVDELLSAVAYLHECQVLHLDLKPDNIMLTRIGHHVKLVDLGYCYQDSFPFTTGGTAEYSAPDKEKTPASDIYSLGRIFQELGIGSKTLIAKCLCANAADRYQSIDELVSAMRKRHFPWKTTVAILSLLLLCMVVWWWMEKKNTLSLPTTPTLTEDQEKSSENVEQDSITTVINMSSENMPAEMKSEVQETKPNNAGDVAIADKKEVADKQAEAADKQEEQIDFLARNQEKAMKLFVPVTDSILGDLKQFVADENKPYQLGGLEPYKAAYESLKNAAFASGRGSNTPFWMQMIWKKYDGKPKPYDPYGDYLYKQLSAIHTLFQTHATNYNLNQKQKENKPQP